MNQISIRKLRPAKLPSKSQLKALQEQLKALMEQLIPLQAEFEAWCALIKAIADPERKSRYQAMCAQLARQITQVQQQIAETEQKIYELQVAR